MLRRTVARAFGAPDAPQPAPVMEEQPGARRDAVARLFSNLHTALGGGGDTASRKGEPASGRRVGSVRARLEGVEFVFDAPGGRLRFLNTLDARILVGRQRGDRWETRELLSVQRARDGDYEATLKLVRGRRTGFTRTTVSALAQRYFAGNV